MTDEEKLQSLISRRDNLSKKWDDADTKLQKAQYDKEIEQKNYEIEQQKRKIADAQKQAADTAREAANQAAEKAQWRNMQLPENLAAAGNRDSSSNYRDGHLLDPGAQRNLDKRAALAQAREDRWQARGIGRAPKAYVPGAAELLREAGHDASNPDRFDDGRPHETAQDVAREKFKDRESLTTSADKGHSDSAKVTGKPGMMGNGAKASLMGDGSKQELMGNGSNPGSAGKPTQDYGREILAKISSIDEKLPTASAF